MTGWKRFKRLLVYRLVSAAAALVSALPFGLALRVGSFGGWLAWWLDRSDRSRAIAQLEKYLGVSAEDAVALSREVFRHFGRFGVELCRLGRFDVGSYVELPPDSARRLAEAVARGKGVVALTAHLGSWELIAPRAALEGHRMVALARENPNPYLGAWLVGQRAKAGVETINRGDPGAAVRIVRALKGGAVVAFVIDQDTRVDSVFVPFFGELAATPIGAAQLALRLGAPVMAGFIRARPGGGHILEIDEVSLDGIEGTKEERALEATRRMSAAIEAAIRRSPGEWVWFHRRWKTRPSDASGASGAEVRAVPDPPA